MPGSDQARRRSVRRVAVFTFATSLAVFAAPTRARAYHAEQERIVDQTAHTLRARELRIGLLQLEYAPLSRLTLGTDTLPWTAGLVFPVVVPNAHAKIALIRSAPLSVSAQGNVHYAVVDAESGSVRAGAFIVPASLFVSSDVHRRWSVHLESTYTHAWGQGKMAARTLSSTGALLASSLQLGAMLEHRLTAVTALLVRGRIQPWSTPVAVRASGRIDERTRADVSAGIDVMGDEPRWAALGGAAFSWANVNLQLAAGYGTLFLPSVGVPLPYRGVIGDANFFLRF